MEGSFRDLDVRDSYGKKFALLLTVTIVLTGTAGASIYFTVDNKITEETQQRLTSTAASEADQLANWRGLTDQQLTSVTRTTAVRSGDRYQIHDRLARVSEREAITGAHLVNVSTGGVPVATGRSAVVTEGDRLRPALADRLAGMTDRSSDQIAYSSPFRRADGTPSVLVAAKTPSRDGRVVLAVVDLPKLSEQLLGARDRNDTGATVTVVNATGTVVLSSDRTALLTRDVAGQTLHGNETGFRAASDGNGTAVGYAPVASTGWTATNQVPAAEAYALRNAVSTRIALLLAVLLLGLGGIGATIGRNTVRAVTDLAENAERLRAGDLDVEIESDRRDEFGSVYTALEEMRRSLRGQIADAETARERAESAREKAEASQRETEALNERLRDSAQEFSAVMADVADGDLTIRLDESTEHEAMREIATAANEMLDELARTLVRVDEFVREVDRSSDQIAASAEEVNRGSEAVSDAVRDISAASSRQRESVERAASELSALSAAIDDVAASADEAAARSEDAAALGQRGRARASEAIEEMDAAVERTEETIEEVEALDREVERIGSIVTLIDDIAEQTNVLALNASIEAQRTGADGDGYAVVADEIKALADETSDATREIEAVVEAVQESSDDVTAGIREMGDQITQSRAAVQSTVESLEAIVDGVADANADIQSINRATDTQAESTDEIVSTMDELRAASERTGTETERAASATAEQTASTANVTDEITDLSTRASDLRALLDTFTVPESTTESASADGTMVVASQTSDD